MNCFLSMNIPSNDKICIINLTDKTQLDCVFTTAKLYLTGNRWLAELPRRTLSMLSIIYRIDKNNASINNSLFILHEDGACTVSVLEEQITKICR